MAKLRKVPAPVPPPPPAPPSPTPVSGQPLFVSGTWHHTGVEDCPIRPGHIRVWCGHTVRSFPVAAIGPAVPQPDAIRAARHTGGGL